jgi:hypothetical protein
MQRSTSQRITQSSFRFVGSAMGASYSGCPEIPLVFCLEALVRRSLRFSLKNAVGRGCLRIAACLTRQYMHSQTSRLFRFTGREESVYVPPEGGTSCCSSRALLNTVKLVAGFKFASYKLLSREQVAGLSLRIPSCGVHTRLRGAAAPPALFERQRRDGEVVAGSGAKRNFQRELLTYLQLANL